MNVFWNAFRVDSDAFSDLVDNNPEKDEADADDQGEERMEHKAVSQVHQAKQSHDDSSWNINIPYKMFSCR